MRSWISRSFKNALVRRLVCDGKRRRDETTEGKGEKRRERGGEDERRVERGEVMKIMCLHKHKKTPLHRGKAPFTSQKLKIIRFTQKKG